MASITTIRTALQTRLKSISGLRAHALWPDQLIPPCVVVQPAGGEYDQTFGKVAASLHRFELHVFVTGAGGVAASQSLLDPYLATGSTGSIYGAIDADRTLGGSVWSTFVRGYREYGVQEIGEGLQYLGAVVDVEVTTS